MAKSKLIRPEGAFCFDNDVAKLWFSNFSERRFGAYPFVFFDHTDVEKTQVRFALSLAIRAVAKLSSESKRVAPHIKGKIGVHKSFASDELLGSFERVDTLGDIVIFEV